MRKYSWEWGCDLYNVETLSCKFWSFWTEIKTAALAQLVLLLQMKRDLWLDFAFFLFVTKVTNRACKWEENYGGTCFIFEETYGRTFCQKDFQSSLWERSDLRSDLFYFLVVIQLAWVREHLALFGLECKDLERLENSIWVLGLAVMKEQGKLQWRRGSMVPDVPCVSTWQTVFSLCGRLVGHLPVCGWLRVACRILKRKASSVTKGWDDKTRDALLQRMVSETVRSVQRDDPAHGDWCAEGQELIVWVDASSLVIGVALERHEPVLEDACWLCPENDAQHINLAELDAILKGINLALQWQSRVLCIRTDFACMYHWVSDTLTGRVQVRTKAASEMLIQRRLNTLKDLIEEYHLTMDVTLVPSTLNLADCLTCVPQWWFNAMKRGNRPEPLIGTTQVDELNADQIRTI